MYAVRPHEAAVLTAITQNKTALLQILLRVDEFENAACVNLESDVV